MLLQIVMLAVQGNVSITGCMIRFHVDTRKKWWNGPTDGGTNETKPYNQVKFRYSEKHRFGDYIFMRAEEMQLVKAEALSCRPTQSG